MTSDLVEVISLNDQNILFALKKMSFIGALSLRIQPQTPTLIGFDFPLTTLVSIARKRKPFLTCTQKNHKRTT
jgi:hypothetical protein